MSKFTEGEWEVVHDNDEILVCEKDSCPVGSGPIVCSCSNEQYARLIAKTPDMYELLHKVLERMNDTNRAFREGYYVDEMYAGLRLIDDDLCRDDIEALLKRINGGQEA